MRASEKSPNGSNNPWLGMSDDTHSQLLRYGVVGAVAFAVDYSLLVSLTEAARLNYLTSAALAFLAGLIVNYQLSIRWVFSHRSLNNRQVEFLLFSAIGIVGLVWTEFILFGGTEWLGMDYRMAKVVAVVAVLFWNFGVRKLVLFRTQVPT